MTAQSPDFVGRLGERLGILRLRNFRRVFLAQSVSVFGDGITPVALAFAVLDLTGSGTDLGLVLAALHGEAATPATRQQPIQSMTTSPVDAAR